MSCDPAVVGEALVDDHELACTLGKAVVVDREEAADRDEVILLRGEDRAVAQIGDRADDRGQRPALPAGLTVLDEDGVLGDAGGVEDQRHFVLARKTVDLRQVLDRERLSAHHVHAGLLPHVGDAVAPGGPERFLESIQIDVAFERKVRARVGCLGDGHVDPDAARQFDVDARSREVEVRRDQLSGLNEHLRQEMLGAPALVRRDQMAISVDLAHGGFEPEEAPRSRVRLVADLHRRALLLRERRRAAIGEEVDVDVLRAQKECVVSARLRARPYVPRPRRAQSVRRL